MISTFFILMIIYLLSVNNKSNASAIWIVAALSSFIVFNAWYFDFYAFLGVFLLIVVCLAWQRKEDVKVNLFFAISLMFSFVMDVRVLSHIGFEKIGIPTPVMSVVMVPLVYILSIRKNTKLSKSLIVMISALIILEFTRLPFILTSPESRNFQTKFLEVGITRANFERDLGIISRAFTIDHIIYYLNMYKSGVYTYLGQPAIILAILSLSRLEKLKGTIILAAFPFFQMLLWSLFVTIDVFQPRYTVASSIFYSILVASAIETVAKSATNLIRDNKIVARKKLKFDLRKLASLLITVMLFVSYVGLTFEAYDEGKKYVEGWGARQKFGWDDAIFWIKNNTTPNDIIASVSGDYFSWYTGRQTVFMWPLPDKNISTLVDLLRTRKVNYLIVDQLFAWHFKDLKMLYDFSDPFLGSKVVFTTSTEEGRNVVIYNVTNIAYGNLTTYELELEWKEPRNWAPLTYYSTGNVSTSQDAVQFDLKVAQTPWPSGGVNFVFPSTIDISQYSCLEFWIKLQDKSKSLVLEIHSKPETNYYSYTVGNIASGQWVKIVFQIKQYAGIYGNPNLKNVDKLSFVVGEFDIGENVTFWIKDLKFSTQEFVLENNNG